MKKQFFLLIMAFSLTFVGCDYDDEFTPPNYVTFDKTSYSLNVNEDSSSTIDVTVYTGNTTGTDRTFTVNVDPSSTLNAAAYDLPSTVTVPANTNEVTFTVDVSDTELNNAGDTLVLTLEEEPGLTAGPASTINIIRVCDFDASAWVGAYNVEEVFVGGQNEGLSLAAAFEETYQVEMDVNPDDSGSVLLSNSDGFDQFFEDGTVLTFGACAGTVSISNRDIAAGFGNLTMTSSSFDAETKTITVDGTLGNFGPFRYILSPVGDDAGEGDGDGDEDGDEDEDEDTDTDTDTEG